MSRICWLRPHHSWTTTMAGTGSLPPGQATNAPAGAPPPPPRPGGGGARAPPPAAPDLAPLERAAPAGPDATTPAAIAAASNRAPERGREPRPISQEWITILTA